MKKAKSTEPPSEEYQRFEAFTKALIAVPKSEIDKKLAAEKHEKADKKRTRSYDR
jgi:hypothetical protein